MSVRIIDQLKRIHINKCKHTELIGVPGNRFLDFCSVLITADQACQGIFDQAVIEILVGGLQQGIRFLQHPFRIDEFVIEGLEFFKLDAGRLGAENKVFF